MLNAQETAKQILCYLTLINTKSPERRLQRTIGATNIMLEVPAKIRFSFKGCKHTNHVQIELDHGDNYKMIFLLANWQEASTVKVYRDISAESLKTAFEGYTKLKI